MIEKACKIDYIAFTHFTEGTEIQLEKYYDVILTRLAGGIPDVFEQMWDATEWKHGGGLRPRAFSMVSDDGITIYYDPRNEYTLVQISGQGCEFLRELGLLDALLELVQDRITRLDVAIDIVCDVTPAEFVQMGYSNRIKSVAWRKSASGETCYLGSRTSQIMTRIYRYNDPHPRSDRLRVEHELKAERAKYYAKMYLQDGLAVLENELATTREFGHPVWAISNLSSSLVQMRGREKQNDTIAWLFRQVAPAVARLHRDGVIGDIGSWLLGEFMEQIETKLPK